MDDIEPPAGSARPVAFGEVLFDRFPDGSAVLGGAPFNVAWHLKGFGLEPLLISRVGDDASGERVLDAMMAWGMDISGVQTDATHPTGTVQVTLHDGQPTFFIVPDQAFDAIDADPAVAALGGRPAAMVYHGTLGQRHAVARAALQRVIRQARAPRFVDANLRPPWSTMELVAGALRDAQQAKLNHDELKQIAAYEKLPDVELPRTAQRLRDHFGIGMLVVTRGVDGALISTADGVEDGAPVKVKRLVDTVGAGDAFSAVAMLGLIRGWSVATLLRRALAFAAAICAVQGATTNNLALYQSCLEQWGGESDR